MEISKVSIVVPAFNEVDAIGEVVRTLKERFAEAEILVVNDGSNDGTGDEARKAGATVLDHERQLGYGASLSTGTKAATREFVLFCDGDGQHSADDVGKLINECDGYDMVVGARTEESSVPLSRRPGKLVLQWFANFLLGQSIPDINSGLRIFRRRILLRYLHLMPRGFSFSTTTTFAMIKTLRRIKYVPIVTRPRTGVSTVRQFRDGPMAIVLMLRLSVLFEPLKVFLSVAGFTFVLFLLSLAIDMIIASGYGISDTTVTLFLSTLIIFMFGLLCDQVSAIRREQHDFEV